MTSRHTAYPGVGYPGGCRRLSSDRLGEASKAAASRRGCRKIFNRHFVATLPIRSAPMLGSMSRNVSRGMLLVMGVTYRIERTEPHCYSVIRLLDDIEVGTFRTLPTLRITTAHIEVTVLRDIVRGALRSARTSAVMHAVPVFQPEGGNAAAPSSASNAVPAARSSSSSPPPEPVML